MNDTFELHADLQRDSIAIGRFPLSLVRLINDRSYPWFVLIPERSGLRDLIDLNSTDHATFWSESREFSQALMSIFVGDKLNVAALGNVTPQLHVHHIVRFANDPAWPAPIWGKQAMLSYTDAEVQNIQQRLAQFPIGDFVAD